jgi:hypothetical protein
MKDVVNRLLLWARHEHGSSESAPTRYACEFDFPAHLEVADMRIAVRQAFADGMAFSTALADANERLRMT